MNYKEAWEELDKRLKEAEKNLRKIASERRSDFPENVRIDGKISGINLIRSYMIEYKRIF